MMLLLPGRLETERLVLRPLAEKDFSAYARFMQDPAATRYLLLTDEQKTDRGMRELFDSVVDSYKSDKPIFVLAICDRATDQYIGSCGLNPLDHQTVECFYTVQHDCWNQGFATEATQRLIQFVAESTGVRRIAAFVSDENPASARVAEKAGMLWVGAISPADRRPPGKRYEQALGDETL